MSENAARHPEENLPSTMYGYLFGLTGGSRIVLATALILSVITAGLSVVQPRVLQKTVNDGIRGGLHASTVELLASLVVGTTIIGAVQAYLSGRGAEAVAHRLRTRLGHRYVTMTIGELDAGNTADLLSRANADSTMVKQFLSAGILPVAGSVLMLTGTMVFMIMSDPMLFAVTAAAFLLGLSLVVAVTNRANSMSAEVQEALGDFSVSTERMLSALRTIKATNAEPLELEHLRLSSHNLYCKGLRITVLSACVQPALNVCIQGSIAAVIVVGTARLASGAISLGALLAYITYMFMMIAPISSLGQAFTQMQIGLGALKRCYEVDFFESEEDVRAGHQLFIEAGTGDELLRFDNVSFSYEPGTPVLDDVNFVLHRGETATIVGRSGSGKSTLLELIERFYRPDSGTISLGGVPIDQLDLNSYRKRLALVGQDSIVLTGTLRENLELGCNHRPDSNLYEALEHVGLTDLLGKKDFSLDTDLGQAGITLSGGQRQRIAWARVLLSDADIILMDEPDSNLDPVTRSSLTRLLERFAATRTVLVVSHNLERLDSSDRVLVMDHGSILADGRRQEILARAPKYQDLLAPASTAA